MSNHGYIISCLGPVVDVQLIADVYRVDRRAHSRVRDGLALSEIIGQKAFHVGIEVFFYPTVYDSITVVRPSTCFREGITTANSMTRFHAFTLDIPY